MVDDDTRLRDELIAMEADDDRTRARLAAAGSLFDGYNAEMEAVHRRNALRLQEIITELGGWPGRALVGEEAASAAWRIVQHAIGEPAFMRACLPLLSEAAARNDIEPAQLAMLIDRIRVLEGRPQVYGTQYDWSADGLVMVPHGAVQEPDSIDERRRTMGLPPMEWRREPLSDEPRPKVLGAEREREMNAWAVRVGWRRSPAP